MRVFISADIEGVTGLVSWSQCGRPDSEHWDFAFARRMMSHDVNAAIRGARRAGATTIVVKDSHGSSKNLLIEDLEPGTELISGHGAGTDGMMQGIDSSFDAAILVGYHAMAGAQAGIMEHTITGGIHRSWINGSPAGEIALAAGVAGRYGVPIVMVSSDEAGCAEASALLPGVRAACVKFGLGRYMGRLLHPAQTGALIEAAAEAGVASRAATSPWVPSEPVSIRLEFNRGEEADMCAKLLGAVRVDTYTLEVSYPTYERAHQACWNLIALSHAGAQAGK